MEELLDLLEPLDLLGLLELFEPLDLLGLFESFEPLDLLGLLELFEPLDLLGLFKLLYVLSSVFVSEHADKQHIYIIESITAIVFFIIRYILSIRNFKRKYLTIYSID